MKCNRSIVLVTAACAGLFDAAPVLAHTGQDGGSYHHGMMWGGGTGWFMGPIVMLLFLAIAVAAVVLVVRWLGSAGAGGSIGGTSNQESASAQQILEERFARGEIDEEEFRQRKKALLE